MNLIDYLQQVKDPRRKQGQRFALSPFLLIIIMAMLCGKYQYREIARFCGNNETYLRKRLGIKSKHMPSHVTIRQLILTLDFNSLQKAFHEWTKSYVQIDTKEWICIDGKSIKSTVNDYSTSYQNFVSMVSLFSQKKEQVLYAEKMENKKAGEAQIVEQLLDVLDLKDVVFTMDALHCKKNATKNHRQPKSLLSKGKSQSAKVVSRSQTDS